MSLSRRFLTGFLLGAPIAVIVATALVVTNVVPGIFNGSSLRGQVVDGSSSSSAIAIDQGRYCCTNGSCVSNGFNVYCLNNATAFTSLTSCQAACGSTSGGTDSGGTPSSSTCAVRTAQAVRVDQCSDPYSSELCNVPYYKDVTFGKPFINVPKVLVTPNHVAALGGCAREAMDALVCRPENVTKTGFRIVCGGSPIGANCPHEGLWVPADANWIATEGGASCTAQDGHQIQPQTCGGENAGGLCSSPFWKRITFSTPYASAPHVIVAPEHISPQGGCVGGATDQVLCLPQTIDATGFTLSCSGSPVGTSCGAESGYKNLANGGWLAMEGSATCNIQSKHGLETTECPVAQSSNTCSQGMRKQVTFDRTFSAVPQVIISPELVTSGHTSCAAGSTDTVFCEAQNITTTGFTAVCWGSPNGAQCGAANEDASTSVLFGYLATDASCPVPTASSSSSAGACRPIHSGIATVGYTNGEAESNHVRVTFPADCPNPSIVTQTHSDSTLCGSASGPGTCINDPASTSTDLASAIGNVTSTGFDVFLTSMNTMWFGGSYKISWQAVCGGDASVPACTDGKLIAGIGAVGFTNGQPESSRARFTLPASCQNPSIVTQSQTDSIACGTGSGPGNCVNDTSTSTDIRSLLGTIALPVFDAFLSSMNNVWVGATSPAYKIHSHAMCQNSTGSTDKLYAGVATVTYTNGQAQSSFTHVDIPAGCKNPSIVTQSHTDSIACGTGSGPGTCSSDSGTTSTDVHSQIESVTGTGFDVFLTSMNNVYVGTSSPQYKISYHIACDATVTGGSSSSTKSASFSSGTGPDLCTPICGDGKKLGSEQCDDGNKIDTDACTNSCKDRCSADVCQKGKFGGDFCAERKLTCIVDAASTTCFRCDGVVPCKGDECGKGGTKWCADLPTKEICIFNAAKPVCFDCRASSSSTSSLQSSSTSSSKSSSTSSLQSSATSSSSPPKCPANPCTQQAKDLCAKQNATCVADPSSINCIRCECQGPNCYTCKGNECGLGGSEYCKELGSSTTDSGQSKKCVNNTASKICIDCKSQCKAEPCVGEGDAFCARSGKSCVPDFTSTECIICQPEPPLECAGNNFCTQGGNEYCKDLDSSTCFPKSDGICITCKRQGQCSGTPWECQNGGKDYCLAVKGSAAFCTPKKDGICIACGTADAVPRSCQGNECRTKGGVAVCAKQGMGCKNVPGGDCISCAFGGCANSFECGEGAQCVNGKCVQLCGNGRLDPGESCDPSVGGGSDGCTATCLLQENQQCTHDTDCGSGACRRGVCIPCTAGGQCQSNDCRQGACTNLCGNGRLDPGEICDPAATDGSAAGCTLDCLRQVGSVCVSSKECQTGLCDPAGSGQGACGSCARNSQCASGLCISGECVDLCGNGKRDPGEQCDDGNRIAGDGCSRFCEREARVAGEVLPISLLGDIMQGSNVQGVNDQNGPDGVRSIAGAHAAAGQTGPAALIAIAGGAAAGWSYMRRKRRK